MVQTDTNKYRYEATKRLLIDLLKTASGLTILLSRPSGSMYQPKYFMKDGDFDRVRFRRSVRYAQNKGYIEVNVKKDLMTILLKEAGQEKALSYAIEDIHIEEQHIWDKKWRMVIFDVPETMKGARKAFKLKLDELGFVQIQKSVYIHAFPCHNEIEYIRSAYHIEQNVRLAIIEKIEGDETLRKHFNV